MRIARVLGAFLTTCLLSHGAAFAAAPVTIAGIKQDLTRLADRTKSAGKLSKRIAGKLAPGALPSAQREQALGHFEAARDLAKEMAEQAFKDPAEQVPISQRTHLKPPQVTVGNLSAKRTFVVKGAVHVTVDKREAGLLVRRVFRVDASGLEHVDTILWNDQGGRRSSVTWRQAQGTMDLMHHPAQFDVTRYYDASGKRTSTYHAGLIQSYGAK